MPTFADLVEILKSWFSYPGLPGDYILIGIVLAIAFSAIWLLGHWPPLFKKHWLWAVAAVSAFLTLLAFVFVQVPLQSWIQVLMEGTWDVWTLSDWLLLTMIPLVLVSGLVQEGAKMVPVVFWWLKSGRNINPRTGLAIGAIAGAGFGIFEAVWIHNQLLLYLGLPWDAVEYGFEGIARYWESFFTVGFHIAATALAGYGLARGKGWQFYLIVAVLHALINYAVVLQVQFDLADVQMETYVAVLAVLVTAAVLLLRWRKAKEEEVVERVEIDT